MNTVDLATKIKSSIFKKMIDLLEAITKESSNGESSNTMLEWKFL